MRQTGRPRTAKIVLFAVHRRWYTNNPSCQCLNTLLSCNHVTETALASFVTNSFEYLDLRIAYIALLAPNRRQWTSVLNSHWVSTLLQCHDVKEDARASVDIQKSGDQVNFSANACAVCAHGLNPRRSKDPLVWFLIDVAHYWDAYHVACTQQQSPPITTHDLPLKCR